MKHWISTLGMALAIAAAGVAGPARALDLSDPEQSLEAFMKVRCATDGSDVVTWWKGTIFAQMPAKAPQAIFGFEGFNICRAEKQEDGSWRFFSRELSFYRDVKTGEILSEWQNPFTGKSNEVLHVANDPVNSVMGAPDRRRAFPFERQGPDLLLTFNVPLSYPNPLQPADWPEESTGEVYAGSEHFLFFAKAAEVEEPSATNAHATIGWTRIGPWLPWMKMAGQPGNLLYIAHGAKIGGIADLPADMQAQVRERFPEYATAPREWVQPNETSWTYYRKVMQERRAQE
jgi:hypothetical protein